MLALHVVTATALLAASVHAAPQLFPFSNLRKYFEQQQSKNAAGNTKSVVPTSDIDTPTLPQEIPTHKKKYSDSYFDADETGPFGVFAPPEPVQNLRPPPNAPAFSYAGFFNQLTNSKIQQPISAEIVAPKPSEFVEILRQTPRKTSSLSIPLSGGLDLIPTRPQQSGAGVTKPSSKNTFASNKYPKKYQPPVVTVGEGDELRLKKKSHYPKRERIEDDLQNRNVAQTINAANFQGTQADSLTFRKPNSPRQSSGEQLASESGFSGISAGAGGGLGFGGDGGGFGGGGHSLGGGGERVEFQMHGHQGPNSYKFGYDTGKGHNRQFRYEERDAHGHVKGHYGFYDKTGKLQHVNYSADDHGFHAGGNFGDRAI